MEYSDKAPVRIRPIVKVWNFPLSVKTASEHAFDTESTSYIMRKNLNSWMNSFKHNTAGPGKLINLLSLSK